MKKTILAAVAGLALLTSQTAAFAQTEESSGPAPGTVAYCTHKWDDMVSQNATGTQDRDDFMRSCVPPRHEGGYYDDHRDTLALLGFGGLIGGIVLLAFTEGDRGHPVSP